MSECLSHTGIVSVGVVVVLTSDRGPFREGCDEVVSELIPAEPVGRGLNGIR